MNSFAPNNKTINGLRNKEPVPEEIYAYGFRPPVQTPDGVYEAGDELPANWLNSLLNEIYSGVVVKDLTPTTPPAGQSGYFAFQIGDQLIQGATWVTAAVAGANPMTYPIPYPAGTAPLTLACKNQSAGVVAPFPTAMDRSDANNHLGCVFFAVRNSVLFAVQNLTWIAIGTYVRNVGGVPQGLQDLRTHFAFSEQDVTYPDGQINVGQPGTITVAQGYQPPFVNNGVWAQGDGLSAQSLNFLLRDLYRLPKYNAVPAGAGGDTRQGAIDFGGILIQWTIINGTAGASTATWTYPTPFAHSDPDILVFDVFGYNAAPAAAEMCIGCNSVNQASATSCTVFVTNGTMKTASSIMVIALGKSSKTAAPTQTKHLDDFAPNNYTYPDGQANKVAPSAAQIADGFTSETASQAGDYLTANKLNWLLNDMYKALKFIGTRNTVKPAGYVNAYPQLTFRLGPLLIQSGRISQNDLNGTGGRVIYEIPFGGIPAVMATQRWQGTPPAVGASVIARFQALSAGGQTDFTVNSRDVNGGAATTDTVGFCWLAIGLAAD